MRSTPSNPRGIAIPLALMVIGISMSFSLQLHAISRTQQQAISSYVLASRRILIHRKLAHHLRTTDTRGSGRTGDGWAQRRYRRTVQQGAILQADGLELWIGQSLPHFKDTTLRLTGTDGFELELRHVGDLHD